MIDWPTAAVIITAMVSAATAAWKLIPQRGGSDATVTATNAATTAATAAAVAAATAITSERIAVIETKLAEVTRRLEERKP